MVATCAFAGLHLATLPVFLLDRCADVVVRLAGARPGAVEEPPG